MRTAADEGVGQGMDATDAIHYETAGEGMVRGPDCAWQHARSRRGDSPRALDYCTS